MKDFIKKLFNGSTDVSSKRFNSFVALLMLCVVIAAAIMGRTVSDSIIYTLGGLIIGNSALTLGEKKE